jgi:hypothetical protein
MAVIEHLPRSSFLWCLNRMTTMWLLPSTLVARKTETSRVAKRGASYCEEMESEQPRALLTSSAALFCLIEGGMSSEEF